MASHNPCSRYILPEEVHGACNRPVSAPQIRSHDFWRYINLYVGLCMYCHFVRRTRYNSWS